MAGDWIKMRIDLQSHPKIVRILSATGADKFRAIGGLHAVWSVFDTHSVDGVLPGYTPKALDHVIGWDGFAEAMMAVGWLALDEAGGLVMPEFGEHNGQSAKRRAEDQKRKRDDRKHPQSVRNLSADDADRNGTREEKRRVKEKPPLSPAGESAQVVLFEGNDFHIPAEQLEKWGKAYPGISIENEVQKASAWVIANPKNRKKNWARFLNGWLKRAQTKLAALDEGDCPVDKIIDLYHRECANLPQVAVANDPVLRGLIVERWNEADHHRASQFWRTLFGRANRLQSIYYRGQNVVPRLELICSRGTFRQLEEQA